MRILLADDHAVVRSGLRHIVADAFPGVEIGEVGTVADLRAELRLGNWSVLILDVAMTGQNSLPLVPELRKLKPELAIVVLSMYSERQFVVQALRAGVLAYVTKDRAPEELIQAIRSVLRGERYLGESIAAVIADFVAHVGADVEAPHKRLSSREHEVFLLLATAQSVSEIAAQLKLSVKTVSTYRHRVLEKLGLRTNADLMRYALQQGLVP